MASQHTLPIDIYREIGKRSALICVVIGLIASGLLPLFSFIMPYYVSTPYKGYNINYYFDRVTYSPDINGTMSYSQCSSDPHNRSCATLTHLSTSIILLNIASFLMIIVLCAFIVKRIMAKKQLITSRQLLCYLVGVFCCWCLITASIHFFMKSFPYTKYCSYNGDGTGCEWYSGIKLLLSSTCLFTVFASVIIGIAVPFCKVFKLLPCFTANDDIDDIDDTEYEQHQSAMDTMYIADINERTNEVINEQKNTSLIANKYNPEKRHKLCAYLSIPECCSIIILCAGLVLINVALIFAYFNEWYPSDFMSQKHVNNAWNNAQCIQSDGYTMKPIIYRGQNSSQCSFEYPDSEGHFNGTFWSCCKPQTCNKAYDYTQLMSGYEMDTNAQSYKCWVDMKAITKASCHPEDRWFVNDTFNISASPKQKKSKLTLCALFCKQTYDHCAEMTWLPAKNESKTVGKLWSRFDEFCEQGLGTEIRYEAFTDRCFAGCAQYNLYGVVFIVNCMILYL